MRTLFGFVALGLLSLAPGCSCDPGPDVCDVPGRLGCACDDGRCQSGLDCVDDLCVDPNMPPEMDSGLPSGFDAGPPRDAGTQIPDVGPNPDAFFANDPPPMVCLEDGGMGPAPDPPGGTPDCPDDKNREGCRCENQGESEPCWPGLRANRNRGICADGTTTCEPFDEFTGRWGPCIGAVLPTEGVVRGPQACNCFSQGRWELDNTSPCFATYSGTTYAVSTDAATGACPSLAGGPPPIPTGPTWSTNRLTVDCEGRFELCYTIRAGDIDDPQPTDCMVTRVCTEEIWYQTRDQVQELPPLPSWSSPDTVCATDFMNNGGYGEMSVVGLSLECESIDDGSGAEFVFNRVGYCSLECNDNPSLPGCENCNRGGSGMF